MGNCISGMTVVPAALTTADNIVNNRTVPQPLAMDRHVCGGIDFYWPGTNYRGPKKTKDGRIVGVERRRRHLSILSLLS